MLPAQHLLFLFRKERRIVFSEAPHFIFMGVITIALPISILGSSATALHRPVDTSEFVVALAASIGFLFALSFAAIPWQVVGALLLGGVVAAPVAAYVVRILPARILGTAVGSVILVTNMRTFMGAIGVEGALAVAIYVLIIAVWLAALVHSVMVNRRERKASAETEVVAT